MQNNEKSSYQFDEEGLSGRGGSGTNIWISIANATNTNELRSYLQANPLTVYYELAQPVVTPVTEIINLPKVYAGGKVTVTSNSGILPKVKYRYPTDNSYVVNR